jgi:hypothetical protein
MNDVRSSYGVRRANGARSSGSGVGRDSELVDRIRELRAGGMTIAAVASALGLPRSTIGDVCKRLGQSGRRGKRSRPVRRPEPRPVGLAAALLALARLLPHEAEDFAYTTIGELPERQRRAALRALLVAAGLAVGGTDG